MTALQRIAGHAGELLVEEVARDGADALVIYLHAGKFVRREGLEFGHALANVLNAHVVVPHYSLAPTHPFPAAPEDAYRAVEWAATRYRHLPMILVGEEAGGNLATVVALMARDRQRPAIAAQILVSPLVDATLCSQSLEKLVAHYGAEKVADCDRAYAAYLPRMLDRTHPYASPATATRLIGVAPALMMMAEADPLREEVERYGRRLAAAGVRATLKFLPGEHAVVDGQNHALIDAMQQFVAVVLSASPTTPGGV